MGIIKNILCGVVLGVANTIPGVSGGTMAVVLNIYDKLLEAVSIKNLKKNILFLFTVALGMGIGILAFSSLITFLYENYHMATSFFFVGLIIGSIPMIFKRARGGERFQPLNLIPFLLALGVMVAIALFGSSEMSNEILREPSLGQSLVLAVCSAVAAFAMVLPGISGSFVLLILGQYTTVLTAIPEFNFAVLIPAGIGIVIGLLGAIKTVKVLLKHFPRATYWAILGLVIGSVFSVYPGFAFTLQGLLSIVALAVGGMGAYLFSRTEA